MTDQPRNLVIEFRRQLEAEVGSDCFELWFMPTNSLEIQGNRLVVGAPDEFSLDRIQSTYQNVINDLSKRMGIDSVEFKILADSSDPSPVLKPEPSDCRESGMAGSGRATAQVGEVFQKTPKGIQILRMV